MDKKEQAICLHDKLFNCAQSVLVPFSDYTGLDEKTALSISGGFGAGAAVGELCGAVSGAIMVIGYLQSFIKENDAEGKKKLYALVREFNKEFKNRYGYLTCRDLKDPEKGRTPCPELITGSVELLEELINKYNFTKVEDK